MRIGSLFSGMGGLDLGVQAAVGGEVAWFCEFEAAPSKVLAYHHPDVPNLGDITSVDWSRVEPVDVICGGSPCQDVSAAGRRAGMRDGTRSGLWASMCDAVEAIRPSLVVWENVQGALSAGANGDMEHCEVCVGDGKNKPLRALGRVLGDLSEIGYDAAWTTIRASDVGAPHQRARVFVVAYPRGGGRVEAVQHNGGCAAGGDGASVFDESDCDANGVGPVREAGAALRPLPTLRTSDTNGAGPHGDGGMDLRTAVTVLDFAEYGSAVARWEKVLERPAPAPTEPTGRGGNHVLSARFVEWMMGLPDGHVCNVPGLSRNDRLKILGNGVVPQQAEMAIRSLLEMRDAA